MEKQRLLSGMQSTHPKLHLGNLEGALRNWVKLQDQYQLYCFVADWHCLTTMSKNPAEISYNTRQVAMDYLAAGIDPDKSIIFVQSHVKEHAELYLLLGMVTSLGKLERVPTYKEKKDDLQIENESYGLLGYPVLQAADILLYKPYGVPVGLDQAPHLELSREIGRTFNHLYGEVFPEFKNIIGEVPNMIGLDGQKKMSKSKGNSVNISDTPEETADKIKTAYTDPEKIRKDDPGHPDGCAVFSLHGVYNKENLATVRSECESGARGCVQCKRECTEAVNNAMMEIRERRALLDLPLVEKILDDGAEKARAFAAQTMTEVRNAMGIR